MSGRRYANVRKYRKRHNTTNVGVIAFSIIFIYLVVMIFIYIFKDNIYIYQITDEGPLAANTEYTGIILRNEEIITAKKSGYVRYYMKQGARARVGDLIYSVDTTGETTKKLAEKYSNTEMLLNDMDLSDIKHQISMFAYDFSPSDFKSVYSFKADMQYAMTELMDYNNREYLREMLSSVSSDGMFDLYYSKVSGIISYNIDGYELLLPEMVKPDNLNKAGYLGKILNTAEFVKENDPVYKLIKGEDWNLVFALSDSDFEKYADLSKLTISLPDFGFEFTAPFRVVQNETGRYGCLTFKRYMSEFTGLRYLNFEVLYDGAVSGLKIPVSSVITKDFYIVPTEYRYSSQGAYGFYLETYDEQGKRIVEFVEPTIYNATDNYYYVDISAFPEGSCLIKINTDIESGDSITQASETARYRIGKTDSLSGVYNVNKGYTVFRKIEILEANNEYYIIKQNTPYGVSLYDHIILDGKTVKEGQIIYQ